MTNYQDEVQEMIKLIKDASQKEILPRFCNVKGQYKINNTNFKELVTEADIKASEFVLNKIRKKFPGSYSEEHKYPDRFEHDLIWQLDPVDGTEEFFRGNKEGYSFLAALLKKQTNGIYLPVTGIIYLPGVDKLWYNDGSNKIIFVEEGKEKQVPTLRKDKLIGEIRKIDPSKKLEKIYYSLGQKLGVDVEIIYTGATGSSISDLLEGKINLYLMNYNYAKDWDIGMAETIIRTLSGFICDFDGNKFIYNKTDIKNYGEPYLMKGIAASIVFNKNEILPLINSKMIENKL